MQLPLVLWVTSLTLVGGCLPAIAQTQPVPQTQPETATATQPTLPWQLVTSTSGRFLVELPGTPEANTGTLTVLNTELTWHTTAVTLPTVDSPEGSDLFEYYMVAYADLPRRLTYEHSQKSILDAVVANLVAELDNAEIRQTLQVEEVAFKGLPARFLTADCFEQFCVGGIAITGDRLYLALAIDDQRESFEHFFESLIFTP